MLQALSAKESKAFAEALAHDLLADLGNAADRGSKAFQARAGKALGRAEKRIQAHRAEHKPNWLQRSRAANAFLWALKQGGCPESYANELTQWFVTHL